MLREQISPFNTAMTSHRLERDFAPTAAALGAFLQHSTSIFSRRDNAIVGLVARGVPTIRETEVDCKRDLETMLKQACENLIVRSYEQALAGLIAFLQRASKPLAEDSQVSFQEQDFAAPHKLLALLEAHKQSVPDALAQVRHRMALYLANAQTEAILFNPIRANVFAALQQVSGCIEANYSQEQAAPMLRALAAIRASVTALEQRIKADESGSSASANRSSASASESANVSANVSAAPPEASAVLPEPAP